MLLESLISRIFVKTRWAYSSAIECFNTLPSAWQIWLRRDRFCRINHSVPEFLYRLWKIFVLLMSLFDSHYLFKHHFFRRHPTTTLITWCTFRNVGTERIGRVISTRVLYSGDKGEGHPGAFKSQRGSRGLAWPFLEPWCWISLGGQGHALAALLPEKDTRHALYRQLCGQDRVQNPAWRPNCVFRDFPRTVFLDTKN